MDSVLKWCGGCKAHQPLSDFHKNSRNKKDGLARWCKKCFKEKRAPLVRNPDVAWAGHLRRTYGITPETYRQLLTSQASGCAICGAVPTDRKLHVDHCHETGEVRQLLCKDCNTGLGCVKDDEVILLKMIEYLIKHRKE